MSFNPSKCQVLHVTRLKTPIPPKYSLHNTELESVSATKYLGVTISEDLNWGVSGNRCESDCRSRGREFDPSPVPYFRGD